MICGTAKGYSIEAEQKRDLINKTEKRKHFLWLNVFIRDIFIIAIVTYLQYSTRFNSKVVFLITGMLIVYITWQLSDYLESQKSNRRLMEQ